MSKDRIYITTAIDYVNGAPHLGHALEKVQADALARYFRAQGRRVHFVTGADEHGAKIARAAEAAHVSAQELVDHNSEKFRSVKNALDLSWDDFIRTSDRARHWPAVQKMWVLLVAAGDIYKKSYKGLYCVGHEAFVTEKDLVGGLCRDHQKPPELIEEENYFFRLSKYSKEIELRIRNNELRIVPETRKNEILALLKEGLEDVSFSRPRKDLEWGIPVPNDETHTIYVWADALVNYISAIGYGTFDKNGLPRENAERFSTWWPAEYHVIGKDILRFHAAIWPGMLLASGLPLPKNLLVHGHMTVDGGKMSKSVGNVVDPFALTEKYGVDAIRYYLLKEIPSSEDGDFSVEKLESLYNGDLANGIGNFAARVLTLGGRESSIPQAMNADFEEAVRKTEATIAEKIDMFRLNEALFAINELVAMGDMYVNEHKVWAITDASARASALGDLVGLLSNIARLLAPFLPKTAEVISAHIVLKDKSYIVQKPPNLFPKINPRT